MRNVQTAAMMRHTPAVRRFTRWSVAALCALALSACMREEPVAPKTTLTPSAAVVPTLPMEFYIMAHQDDWQFFAGDRAALSLATASKIVLVYTTAGDGGFDMAYWRVREEASKASVNAI